jgi:hypothetical protein
VWLWAGTLGPALVLAGLVGVVILVALLRDPQSMRLGPLIDYVRSPNSRQSITRDAVGVYIAGHFRQRIVDQRRAPTRPFGFTPRDWATADSIVVAHPTVTAEQLAAADRLVDGKWHGVPPGQMGATQVLLLLMPIVGLGFCALAGLFTSFLVRRGVVLRLLGLDIVTRRGTAAGRIRLVWRQVVIWLGPALFASAIGVTVAAAWKPIPIALAVLGMLSPLGFLVGFKTPERSMAERLSGTMVVPE